MKNKRWKTSRKLDKYTSELFYVGSEFATRAYISVNLLYGVNTFYLLLYST